MPSSDTLSESSSVTWTVDFSTSRDQLVLVYLVVLAGAFVALVFTVRHVWTQLQRSRTMFWRASMLGVVLLLPAALGEYGFTLSMWSQGTLWSFPPLLTFLVTACVRMGYGCITICRLYRLYLISATRPIDALRRFRLMSLVITFVISINLASSAALRIIETYHAKSRTLESEEGMDTVQFYRDQHKYFGFITFIVVHMTNLACDYLFAKRVMESATTAAGGGAVTLQLHDMVRLLLPYIPPATTTIAYVAVTMLTLVDGDRWRMAVYFSIGLNRMAPVVEASCFYLWSVGHTRMLLKALRLSHTKSDTPATDSASAPLSAIPLDSYYAKSVSVPQSPAGELAHGPPPAYSAPSPTITLETVTASTTVGSESPGFSASLDVPRAYTPPQRTRQIPRSPQPRLRVHF